jgi:hypothetical protein
LSDVVLNVVAAKLMGWRCVDLGMNLYPGRTHVEPVRNVMIENLLYSKVLE